MSGKQSKEYHAKYYQDNKERIRKRNKEAYIRRRSTPEGLKNHRERATEATRRHRKKHPEKIKLSRRQTYINRKIRAFEKIGGAICANCGCNEIEFLEINHKNGNGCKEHKRQGNNLMDRILQGSRKTSDLECLCRICNALDFLSRKDLAQSKRFNIRWEEFTGQTATLEGA